MVDRNVARRNVAVVASVPVKYFVKIYHRNGHRYFIILINIEMNAVALKTGRRYVNDLGDFLRFRTRDNYFPSLFYLKVFMQS